MSSGYWFLEFKKLENNTSQNEPKSCLVAENTTSSPKWEPTLQQSQKHVNLKFSVVLIKKNAAEKVEARKEEIITLLLLLLLLLPLAFSESLLFIGYGAKSFICI